MFLDDQQNQKKYRFEKKEVTIGGKDADVSLPLEEPGVLVRLIADEKGFQVFNEANDPFVTLNDFPFGKQTIVSGDCLNVHDFPLFFKEEEEEEKESKESFLDLDVDALFRQVEELSSGEGFVLEEFDDENESFHVDHDSSSVEKELPYPPRPKQEGMRRLKKTAFFVLGFLSLLLLGAPIVFSRMSGTSSLQELRAAAGVADVAMALTYARLNQIKPNQQNWSDPEFLKNNLAGVVSPKASLMQEIDPQGKFCSCAYLLRIYTSIDLSHFLVIAQPSANLFQRFFPKAAIVVDSISMELRKTTDLKTLNRLLVNTNMLDETNVHEVFQIVEEGQKISLEVLAESLGEPQFAPPLALSFLRPGSENYIYNAPRYHHFGERFLERATLVLENPEQPHEIIRLSQEAKEISQLKDSVLFTSQGVHVAVDAQKALAFFFPNKEFLIAYLKSDSQGNIKGSHLLMNDVPKNPSLQEEEIAFEEDLSLEVKSPREVELTEISEKIQALLERNNHEPIPNFKEQLEALLESYFSTQDLFSEETPT